MPVSPFSVLDRWKVLGFLYYKACDRYYHWYVHEDIGFRLRRKDLIFYSATFWVFAASEEVYWLAKRGGADDQSPILRITNSLITGSFVMYIFLDREIRKRKKAYEATLDSPIHSANAESEGKHHAVQSTEQQS